MAHLLIFLIYLSKNDNGNSKAGLPSRLSNSAGTFVCNHILYQLGYMADHFYPDLLLGFIHVPLIPEQTINHSQQSSMSVEDIVKD